MFFSRSTRARFAMAVAVLGILIAVKRPANPIGWLSLIAGLFLGLWSFGEAYGVRALVSAPGSLPAGRAVASISNAVWPVPIALLILLLLLFPTGTVPSRRWRPVAVADLMVSAILVLSTGII